MNFIFYIRQEYLFLPKIVEQISIAKKRTGPLGFGPQKIIHHSPSHPLLETTCVHDEEIPIRRIRSLE